jgi:hypothetical protein
LGVGFALSSVAFCFDPARVVFFVGLVLASLSDAVSAVGVLFDKVAAAVFAGAGEMIIFVRRRSW